MKYYKVKVKCGHVGRNKFIEKCLYIKAENGKQAARKARLTSRVKHHQKNAIISVKEINLNEYSYGIRINFQDPYFQAHSKQEQNYLNAVKEEEIQEEPKKAKYRVNQIGKRLRDVILAKELDQQIKEVSYYE